MTRFDDGGSEPVDVGDVTLLGETDKAIRITSADLGTRWVPKSAVHDDSEVWGNGGNARGKLVVKAWLAKKEGWA